MIVHAAGLCHLQDSAICQQGSIGPTLAPARLFGKAGWQRQQHAYGCDTAPGLTILPLVQHDLELFQGQPPGQNSILRENG